MILAQANAAMFRWSLTDARMSEFVARIDQTHELAGRSPGFIWRYADTYDPAAQPEPFNNPLLFFNMSVWQDVESLRNYVLQTDHVELLQRKEEWTHPADTPPLVMWWIDDDGRPTVGDAIKRFLALARIEMTTDGFTFEFVVPSPHD